MVRTAAVLLSAALAVGGSLSPASAGTAGLMAQGCGVVENTPGEAAEDGYKGVTGVPGTTEAYAAGSVTSGGVTSMRLDHRVNGSWSEVAGVPPVGTTRNALSAVAASGPNDVWAVGTESDGGSGSPGHGLVAHYDGTGWTSSAAPEPAGAVSSTLTDVGVIGASDAWAVGAWTDSSGVTRPLALHYTSSWMVTPWPAEAIGTVRDVATTAAGDAMAVLSGAQFARWNGTTWYFQPVPSTDSEDVGGTESFWSVAATSANDIWLAGDNYGEFYSPLLWHWNGSSWSGPPKGFTAIDGLRLRALTGVMTTVGDQVWLTGFVAADDTSGSPPTDWSTVEPARAAVMHYNGAQWRSVDVAYRTTALVAGPDGVDGVHADDIAAVSDGLLVVGDYDNGGYVNELCGANATSISPPAGTTSTNDGDESATPNEPIETEVTLPTSTSGTVEIRETYVKPAVVGVNLPDGIPYYDPATVRFTLDSSRYYGNTRTNSAVWQNGERLPPCPRDPPCVESDVIAAGGDHHITVHLNESGDFEVGQAPVTAHIKRPKQLHRPAKVVFNDDVASASQIYFNDGGSPICRSQSGATVSCRSDGIRSAWLKHNPNYGARSTVYIGPSVVDENNVAVGAMHKSYRESPLVIPDQDHGYAVRQQWGRVASSTAIGGAYATSHLAGATANLAFNGRSVTWHTRTGPRQGIAALLVDGRLVRTTDLYSPRSHSRASRRVSGLTDDLHTLTIRVTGRKNPHSHGTVVAVDGYGFKDFSSNSELDATYQWPREHESLAVDGLVSRGDQPGATWRASFVGTSVIVRLIAGPNGGEVRIDVDNTHRTIDTYSKHHTVRRVRITPPFHAGNFHQILLTVLRAHNPHSHGRMIELDECRLK